MDYFSCTLKSSISFHIIPNPYDFLFRTWKTKVNELASRFHREGM